MSPNDRRGVLGRWLAGPRGLMVFAVVFLFLLMSWAFLVAPWGSLGCGGSLCSAPITDPANESQSVTGALFGSYPILVLVIGLVLASCMIGGVYLAKVEGGQKP